MFETVFTSFAHDNTPYVSGDSKNAIIKSLKDEFINAFKWFLDNEMKANSNKCHLFTSKQSCMNLKIV